MPKLNRWLITSIIDDIKELISVANEMCSWIGKVDHFSWRFPNRFARNVNAMGIVKNHQGSAGEMYILLLEIAYDRMHFVLRLVIEFIESYPFVDDFFEELPRPKSPGNMSLANVIRTLWHRLKSIPETITRNMIKTKHLENSKSRSCQASGSLFFCESCSCASKAVKDVAKIISTALQKNNLSSVILAELELIGADLFGKTQWAVMSKLVEAIDADVKNLLETTLEIRIKSEADAKEREISVRNFLVELENQKIEKSFLEMKVKERTDELQAVNSQLHKLKEAHMELVEENQALTESLYKSKKNLSNFEILLAITQQQMIEMAESKVALESSVKNLHKEMTTAQQACIIETEKLEKSLDLLRSEKVSRENQYLEEVQSLNKKHNEVIEKLQKYAKLSASTFLNSYSPEVEIKTEERNTDTKTAEILVPKSDPEIDMAEQLAANEETIEKLKGQNERLSRTLNRLKEHRKIFLEN